MSKQAALAPQRHEAPVDADSIRADAFSGLQERDATDVMRMLFRSECFVEDLDDAYAHDSLCAMH